MNVNKYYQKEGQTFELLSDITVYHENFTVPGHLLKNISNGNVLAVPHYKLNEYTSIPFKDEIEALPFIEKISELGRELLDSSKDFTEYEARTSLVSKRLAENVAAWLYQDISLDPPPEHVKRFIDGIVSSVMIILMMQMDKKSKEAKTDK